MASAVVVVVVVVVVVAVGTAKRIGAAIGASQMCWQDWGAVAVLLSTPPLHATMRTQAVQQYCVIVVAAVAVVVVTVAVVVVGRVSTHSPCC